MSLVAAQVSAIMEALESFHAENTALDLILASYAELKNGRRLLDPAGMIQYVRNPYAETDRVLWVEGIDLLSGNGTLVPFDCVHADFAIRPPVGTGSFPINTNGLASGNHILEATCHAICELIERDALTLWEALDDAVRLSTQVDPQSVTDASCREMLDVLDRAGVSYVIWNVTSDIAVPAFFCQIRDRHQGASRTAIHAGGSGCHLDAGIALLRSISEAVQSRLTAIAGSRDDLSFALYRTLTGSVSEFAEGAQPPVMSFRSVPSLATPTFEGDLAVLKNMVAAAGLGPVVAVDLSRDDMNIPVVRVVIPGLESAAISEEYTIGRRLRGRKSA